jgi:hypothetical protein
MLYGHYDRLAVERQLAALSLSGNGPRGALRQPIIVARDIAQCVEISTSTVRST